LGASSWSSISLDFGLVVGGKSWFFFIFDLLCKRFSSSPCIGLAVCGFIYKSGETLFRGEEQEATLRMKSLYYTIKHCTKTKEAYQSSQICNMNVN
jgi:hypothetical protein